LIKNKKFAIFVDVSWLVFMPERIVQRSVACRSNSWNLRQKRILATLDSAATFGRLISFEKAT
jgi:hypothetical protein